MVRIERMDSESIERHFGRARDGYRHIGRRNGQAFEIMHSQICMDNQDPMDCDFTTALNFPVFPEWEDGQVDYISLASGMIARG